MSFPLSPVAWILCHGRCECDSCGRRSRGMARGAFSVFTVSGRAIAHSCPSCVRDGFGLVNMPRAAALIKGSRSKFPRALDSQPSKPEPRAVRVIDARMQLKKLRELGHGFADHRRVRRGDFAHG